MSVSMFFNESVDLGFKETISNFVSQDDLSHMYVLFVKRIIEFDALEFVGPFFTFLNEAISFTHITDFTRKILKFFFPDLFIFMVEVFAVLEVTG